METDSIKLWLDIDEGDYNDPERGTDEEYDLNDFFAHMDKCGEEEDGKAHALDVNVDETADAFGIAGDYVTYDIHISTSLVGMCKKLQDELVDGVAWTYCYDTPRYPFNYTYTTLLNPDDKLCKTYHTIDYGKYQPPGEERVFYEAQLPIRLKPRLPDRHRFDIERHNVAFIFPSHMAGSNDTFQLLRLYKNNWKKKPRVRETSENVECIQRLLVSYAWKCLSQSDEFASNCPKGVSVMVHQQDKTQIIGGQIRRTPRITHACGMTRDLLNPSEQYKKCTPGNLNL